MTECLDYRLPAVPVPAVAAPLPIARTTSRHHQYGWDQLARPRPLSGRTGTWLKPDVAHFGKHRRRLVRLAALAEARGHLPKSIVPFHSDECRALRSGLLLRALARSARSCLSIGRQTSAGRLHFERRRKQPRRSAVLPAKATRLLDKR